MKYSKQTNTSSMIPETPSRVVKIQTQTQLTEFIEQIQNAPWIAVDTEFLRERSYFPVLCLVQLASTEQIGLVDTLALADLTPLVQLMANPHISKIFHAADQDIEILTQSLNVTPAPIFDTQIAAGLTGLEAQIGYAKLIEKLIGKHLPKTETRADWTRRPISPKALAYAADDVRWLCAAYPLLVAKLDAIGRLDWVWQDSLDLAQAASHALAPEHAWRRIKYWYELPAYSQQVLWELAYWREITAIEADRPRRWILADEAIMDIAYTCPDRFSALKSLKTVPDKVASKHGKALLAAIQNGLSRPAKVLANKPQPLTHEQKQDVKKLKKRLKAESKRLDIPGPVLAKRKELEQLVRGEHALKILSGWRKPVIGDVLVAELATFEPH